MTKSALQQIYSKLQQNQDALGSAIAACKRISASPLFDPIYYTKRYEDVGQSGLEPIAHYVIFGAAEARSPHPLFDARFYRDCLTDKVSRTNNPLRHYLVSPDARELWPNRLFDPKFYLSQTAADVSNPLEHYITVGAANGLDPFPLFDSSFYSTFYKDVGASQINPLVHYLLLGAFEGRAPHYLFDTEHYLRSLEVQCIPYTNLNGADTNEILSNFYEQALKVNHPDNPTLINPLIHYLKLGAEEERNPHPLFSTKFYLSVNADVREAGENPLVHYVTSGQQQHRKPHELFDPKFYLQNLGEVSAGANKAPLVHFLSYGGKNAVSPHPLFDSAFYLRNHPELAAGGVNPLAHYLKIESLGHRLVPNPSFDGLYYSSFDEELNASGLSALEHYIGYGESEKRPRNFFEKATNTGVQHGFDETIATLDQIKFRKPSDQVKVAIVLFGPTPVESDFLRCLRAISRQNVSFAYDVLATGKDIERIIQIAKQLDISWFAEDILSESEACNRAVQFTEAEVLVFLRKDFQVLSDWLANLVANYATSGIVCSATLSPLGRILNCGASLDHDAAIKHNLRHTNGFNRDLNERLPVAVVPRGSIAISRRLFSQLSGYDTTISSISYQDADLSHRANLAGFENFLEPLSRVVSLTDYGSDLHSVVPVSEEDLVAQRQYLERRKLKV
jgi:hypothetical protein